MYSEEQTLEYLKRKIKRTYKRYTKERTDRYANIRDVAKLFNIFIDKERLDDYNIVKIDFKHIPSIKIVDNKNNIKYEAIYTNYDRLNNLNSKSIKYVDVKTIYSNVKSLNQYYIGDKNPTVEILIIKKDNYLLNFQNLKPKDFNLDNGIQRFIINLLQKVNYNNEERYEQLYTKMCNRQYYNNLYKIINHYFTYKPNNIIIKDNNIDICTYTFKDNLIYSITKEVKGKSNIKGICFEKNLSIKKI